MHVDMHFYGTYCLARAAGIPPDGAYTIAYAAQFVDDSSEKNSEPGKDGSLMFSIATTHRLPKAVASAALRRFYETFDNQRALAMQRQIWMPFHFLPGGQGKTLEQKMICIKDSKIAQDMFDYHLQNALVQNDLPEEVEDYTLHGLGIAAHVYMDTFAHYGFVGEGSDMNAIKQDSLKINNKKPSMEKREKSFTEKYLNLKAFSLFKAKVKGEFAELGSDALGHGGVLFYPDEPYLNWQFKFEQPRPNNGFLSERNNQSTYLEGCKKLYWRFKEFRKGRYDTSHGGKDFAEIEEGIKTILAYEGEKQERAKKWRQAMNDGTFCTPEPKDNNIRYDPKEWERQQEALRDQSASQIVKTDIYKFHQAAAMHRWYVLKSLLPRYGIVVL